MHIDEGANVQLCQSVRGQMSLHAIFGQGANVRGRGGDMSYTPSQCLIEYIKGTVIQDGLLFLEYLCHL